MLVTVSGPAGSGKTTFAEALAAELGYEYVSGGDIFRSLADERGVSLVEFNRLAEEDDGIPERFQRLPPMTSMNSRSPSAVPWVR